MDTRVSVRLGCAPFTSRIPALLTLADADSRVTQRVRPMVPGPKVPGDGRPDQEPSGSDAGRGSHATPPGVVPSVDDSGGVATHDSHGEGNAISIPGKSQEPRVNERIRIPQVRVIGDDGSQIGILATREAIAMAQAKGLDLVEVAPTARPPVCKIMDYGKFKYETNRAAKE